jgi:hypothetical protein
MHCTPCAPAEVDIVNSDIIDNVVFFMIFPLVYLFYPTMDAGLPGMTQPD